MARDLDRPDELEPDLRMGLMTRAKAHGLRLMGQMCQRQARGGSVAQPSPGSRGAVVKCWISKPSTTGAHPRYLRQEKGLDGQDADLFSREGMTVDPRTFAREAAADPHQYRLIVSLPDGDRLDRTAYTQRLMRQVERDLLGPVDWIGATHRDTPHVHTHLIIRGRDPAGQDLYIHPRCVREGLRARARALATDALGPLTASERQGERQRPRQVKRFVDTHVLEAKQGDGMEALDSGKAHGNPPHDGVWHRVFARDPWRVVWRDHEGVLRARPERDERASLAQAAADTLNGEERDP